MVIVVAGTPGSGKTSLASRLARLTGRPFTTLSWLVLERGLWLGYDRERRSFIIDEDALCKELERLTQAEPGIIVETHWPQPLARCSKTPLEAVILTRCRPDKLAARLRRRAWPERKILENVEAELLGVIAADAVEAARAANAPIIEVDTSNTSPQEAAEHVLAELGRGGKRSCCIDWLSETPPEVLDELLRILGRRL